MCYPVVKAGQQFGFFLVTESVKVPVLTLVRAYGNAQFIIVEKGPRSRFSAHYARVFLPEHDYRLPILLVSSIM